MSKGITESVVEDATLDWLRELDHQVLSGLAIAPGEVAGERADYKQVFLFARLQTGLAALNPKIPAEGLQEALRKEEGISGETPLPLCHYATLSWCRVDPMCMACASHTLVAEPSRLCFPVLNTTSGPTCGTAAAILPLLPDSVISANSG